MKQPPVRAYSVDELRAIYGKKNSKGEIIPITRTVFFSWLKPIREKIGEMRGRIFTPKQVKIIFDHLDRPDLDEE